MRGFELLFPTREVEQGGLSEYTRSGYQGFEGEDAFSLPWDFSDFEEVAHVAVSYSVDWCLEIGFFKMFSGCQGLLPWNFKISIYFSTLPVKSCVIACIKCFNNVVVSDLPFR